MLYFCQLHSQARLVCISPFELRISHFVSKERIFIYIPPLLFLYQREHTTGQFLYKKKEAAAGACLVFLKERFCCTKLTLSSMIAISGYITSSLCLQIIIATFLVIKEIGEEHAKALVLIPVRRMAKKILTRKERQDYLPLHAFQLYLTHTNPWLQSCKWPFFFQVPPFLSFFTLFKIVFPHHSHHSICISLTYLLLY